MVLVMRGDGCDSFTKQYDVPRSGDGRGKGFLRDQKL